MARGPLRNQLLDSGTISNSSLGYVSLIKGSLLLVRRAGHFYGCSCVRRP